MIPGLQSKLSESVVASAATIVVKTDIAMVSGSTQVDTILSPLMGSNMMIILIPTAGSIVLGTGGNILIGITAVINRAVWLVWNKRVGKWYINSGV
ncbi:MAG: hypothetical protein ABWY25_10200 [Paenisporosarcina sp.]